ncbi:YbbR domain-containing protein [Amphibacillus marinus]|uniref:YbbR domain-containing protein n=1 Tax=Amphibacillus marinus TaxID=872970 RepID=A0A1H8TEB0_9BACI|nr:CdaR family protein [Amphibacillus marinus]SEO89439.1 YbbR domain-containing protein [Amphibacillus marinus]
MNDWLNKPWVIRITSLFLAVLTFFVISFDNQDTRTADIGGIDSIFNSSQETEVIDDVPVSIQIDDERYVVSGVPQTVSLTLQGTVSVVQSTAMQRNFDVFVDLEDLEPGTHVVPIEYEGISSRLNVAIDPPEVEISIEERGMAEFEVTVDYTNLDQLQAGFELGGATVTPGTVTITSSQSIIDRISIVKAFVDVEGIGESLSISDVPVRVYDNEGNQLNARVEPDTVSIDVEVNSPNKTVPIELQTTGELSEELQLVSIELDQEEVQVFAAETDLTTINEIITEQIDLTELTESTTVEVDLVAPDAARLLSTNSVAVSIELEELTEQTIEDVEIEVENLSNAFTSSFLNPETGMINLTVIGFPSILTELSQSDFQLMIDLSGLNDGEHQVPIELSAPNNLEVTLATEEATIQLE